MSEMTTESGAEGEELQNLSDAVQDEIFSSFEAVDMQVSLLPQVRNDRNGKMVQLPPGDTGSSPIYFHVFHDNFRDMVVTTYSLFEGIAPFDSAPEDAVRGNLLLTAKVWGSGHRDRHVEVLSGDAKKIMDDFKKSVSATCVLNDI